MIFFSDINFYSLTVIILSSYLIGSIAFGIVVAKLMNLGNLRQLGSGNIGATNVLRTGSKIAAALTLILDGGKGYAVVNGTIFFLGNSYVPFTAMAVFLGHIFPIYYKFKGGKGVATFIGIILAISPFQGILVCIAWLSIAAITKKSSVAALGSSITAPVVFFYNKFDENVFFVSILTLLIWWLHKENIKRLILKTEPSINLMNKKRKDL